MWSRRSLRGTLVAWTAALLAVATLGLASESATEPTQAERAAATRRVMAFFYLWYGDETSNYTHWNHQVLPHWQSLQNIPYEAAIGKRFAPPDEIHAPFWPKRGLYRSDDPAVLRSQMRELRLAGVGVAVISWWGRPDVEGTHDTQGVSTDAAVPAVLEAAEAEGVRIAFHLEPYAGRSAESVVDDVAYIGRLYGGHPAVLRTSRAAVSGSEACAASLEVSDGAPLFFVYDSYHIDPTSWKASLAGPLFGKGVFVGLVLEHRHVAELAAAGFDGGYTYFATNGFSFGSTTANWPAIARALEAESMAFLPSVAPGYDDRRIRPWNGRNTRPRAMGAYYKSMWRAALEASPRCPVVTVTSYNEFGEGTNIEPSVPHTVPEGRGIDAAMRAALGEAGAPRSQDFQGVSYLGLTQALAVRTVEAAASSAAHGASAASGRAERSSEL